jgi:hypothetical protein
VRPAVRDRRAKSCAQPFIRGDVSAAGDAQLPGEIERKSKFLPVVFDNRELLAGDQRRSVVTIQRWPLHRTPVVAVSVVSALSVMGCSCSSPSQGPSVPAALRRPSTSVVPVRALVTEVDVRPYPEGSVVQSRATPPPGYTSPYYGARFTQMLETIGLPLPDPLPQPEHCDRGSRTLLVEFLFDDGNTVSYGPCIRPPAIEHGLDVLFP